MESNTAKLKAEAEARILQEMEEEHALHNEVQEKKRQYLLMEKARTINELLDLQVSKPLSCRETIWNLQHCFRTILILILSFFIRLLY